MAEEKRKKPKHEKMYKDSPKLERDKESGKMGVTKKEKESAKTDSGTDGMPEHETHAMEMHHRHAKERMDLHHKHEKEQMDMAHQQMTEGAPAEEAGAPEQAQGAE